MKAKPILTGMAISFAVVFFQGITKFLVIREANMIKKSLLFMLLLLLVFPAANSFSTNFNYASLWSENRYYESTNQYEYGMLGDTGLTDNFHDIYMYIPTWTGHEYQKLSYYNYLGSFSAGKFFTTTDGYPPPGAAYEGRDIYFFSDEDGSGDFNSSIDHYELRSYPSGTFNQLPLVTNVKTSYSGPNLIVSWDGIPLGDEFGNDGNDQYRVRIIDKSTTEYYFDSGKISIDPITNKYSYNLGDLSAYGGDIWIAIEAREGIGSISLANRSRYYKSASPVFVDVPPGYWAEAAIYKIYNAGITKGCSQNPLMYCPEDIVSRDQMAVFLGRAIHGSSFSPPPATGIFNDVPATRWAANWIEQFYKDGITSGCPFPNFCPGSTVNRDQMAIFLLRAKHGSSYTPPPATGIFADVPATRWAAAWIEQLYHEGITAGCATGPLRYCPDNSVTRAEMAKFIVRTFGL